MNLTRRRLLAALTVAPVASPLLAQSGGDTGYTTLPNALAIENPAKVEVAEFFWYGCIHCYSLEPVIKAWLAKLPADAYFRRIPAVFNARWGHDAAIFYSFEALGMLDRLHEPFFDAIHRDRLQTDKPAALNEWLGRNGVEQKKFDAAMQSFGVQSKVKRATQMTAGAQIDGTPALMVQGRYTISTEQGRTREGMLANADRLVAMVRKSLGKAK